MADEKHDGESSSQGDQARDSRKAHRRQTIAPVTTLDGQLRDEKALVMNVSLSGAYIRTRANPPVGARIFILVQLPSGAKGPIRIGGRVVRADQGGVGVQFEDLHYRDRSLIRGYASFLDQDDAVVALQGSIPHILTGNLLPISDKGLIKERLLTAARRDVPVMVALSIKPRAWIDARLEFVPELLHLRELERPIPERTSIVYCAVLDGPLHSVFEGLVSEHGGRPRLLLPERIYHNDRRCSRRLAVSDAWLCMQAPHCGDGSIRMPVVDVSEGGCAVLVPKTGLITLGMRFPSIELINGQKTARHDGAMVTRVAPCEMDDHWLIGLSFLDVPDNRDAFSRIQKRSVSSSLLASIRRLAGVARKKALDLLGRGSPAVRQQVHVCQYKNTLREKVVGILDATFDLNETPPAVDAAVLIGPPFQVRKEMFALLSRTLIDNFKRDGLNAVVLRFDMTHMIGESHSDPEPEGDAPYFYNWTYSTFESDLIGGMAYLKRKFQPAKRIMVSFSVAAIPARRMIADGHKPGVDLWIAPFGCPDGQDQFKFLTAGVDLFQKSRDGETLEPIYIYGRRGDVNEVVRNAIQRKMGFLEDARNDLSKIMIPVTWILGTYDFIVTRERVRQMLNAPGGGPREIIELPSGHLLKTGPEAIESYKLIYEIIAKHMLCEERPAAEPDMASFVRQSEAEWARVKRTRIKDNVEFWDRHLFGASEEVEGYDMFMYNPDYVDMMRQQAGLIDVRPNDRVADLGCGTGNLSIALLEKIPDSGMPFSLTCCDLVPKAVQRTRTKIEEAIVMAGGMLDKVILEGKVVDLEAARLAPLRDFLSGKLYGPVALAGRVEGLETTTLRKIAADYGPSLHKILHGGHSSIDEVIELCPSLDRLEAEIVLELSMASRFLRDETVPEDLRPGLQQACYADDLAIEHLHFGRAPRDCHIDLPSESFDKIGASIVLPYLYDPLSAVEEFHRLLAPGGAIVLSSPKPNFDSSKSYMEEAQSFEQRTDLDEAEKERLLRSLRELAAFVSHVLEMEDEGRFRFFSPLDLVKLMEQAGFENVSTIETLGDPPTAVIVRAEKV